MSSLFGTTASTPSTGLLFGTSSLPSGSSSLFGSSATPSTTSATTSAAGSLFGTTAPSTSSTGSSNLFGAPSTSASTGSSLFGSTATPSAGSNLFGSTATPQSTASTGSSLFGAPSTTATSSLFGQPTTAATNTTPSSSLFGATSSLTPALTSNTSLFGQPQATAAPSSTSSLFGTPTTSNSLALVPASTLNQPRKPEEILDSRSVEARIAEYIQSISPESPYCKFLYWFYNYQGQSINPKLVPKPLNITDEQWQYAQSQNPDPNLFVPVPARSFNDLKDRKLIQEKNIDLLFNNTMDSLNNIKSLQNYLTLQIQSQLEAMKKRNMLLLHKYIEVWSNLEIYRGKGRQVTNAEEHLLRRVKQIADILNQPNSLPSKVEEISNQVVLSNLERERIQFQLRPESLEALFTLFKTMTNSIESMSNDLESSLQDANILKNELIKIQRY